MAEYSYLKPKVAVGDIGQKKRIHGMFVNVSSYIKLGGLSSADKVDPTGKDPSLAIEKSPSARSGKPI
jgi:hypothetical protein